MTTLIDLVIRADFETHELKTSLRQLAIEVDLSRNPLRGRLQTLSETGWIEVEPGPNQDSVTIIRILRWELFTAEEPVDQKVIQREPVDHPVDHPVDQKVIQQPADDLQEQALRTSRTSRPSRRGHVTQVSTSRREPFRAQVSRALKEKSKDRRPTQTLDEEKIREEPERRTNAATGIEEPERSRGHISAPTRCRAPRSQQEQLAWLRQRIAEEQADGTPASRDDVVPVAAPAPRCVRCERYGPGHVGPHLGDWSEIANRQTPTWRKEE